MKSCVLDGETKFQHLGRHGLAGSMVLVHSIAVLLVLGPVLDSPRGGVHHCATVIVVRWGFHRYVVQLRRVQGLCAVGKCGVRLQKVQGL